MLPVAFRRIVISGKANFCLILSDRLFFGVFPLFWDYYFENDGMFSLNKLELRSKQVDSYLETNRSLTSIVSIKLSSLFLFSKSSAPFQLNQFHARISCVRAIMQIFCTCLCVWFTRQ